MLGAGGTMLLTPIFNHRAINGLIKSSHRVLKKPLTAQFERQTGMIRFHFITIVHQNTIHVEKSDDDSLMMGRIQSNKARVGECSQATLRSARESPHQTHLL